MTKKSLCVVTGTRAEYGLLRPVLQKLLQSAVIEPRLVVTGAHLAPEFGNTVSEIEADGMPIAARIPILKFGTGSPLATARTVSYTMERFTDYFGQNRPDAVLVLGDRYEIFAAGAAAALLEIPLAHISGGDVTGGGGGGGVGGGGGGGAARPAGFAFLTPPLGGLCFFLYSKGPLHFTRPGMRLREFGQACFNGSSEMIAQLSISVTTYLFNITMLRLAGEAGVAALTITAYSEYFLVTLFLGFSMGVAPVISYNYGSGNHARQRRIFRSCLLFICVGSILVFSAALLGASRLIGIFAPPDSRVFALADQGFHIFVFNFLFCGYGIFASSLFTALSNGKVSAIIAFLRTFALIALFLLVLPEFLGLTGVWLAAPLAEAISALVAAFFVWRWRGTYQYL